MSENFIRLTRTAWQRFRRWPVWGQVAFGVLALSLIGTATDGSNEKTEISASATTSSSTSTTSSSSTTTSTTTTPTTTTTTAAAATSTATAAVPAGDDAEVTRITDGDTIQVTGGTRIRLIGIDTPESTTRTECYGKEASAHIAKLLPVGTRVRLVYDVERLDRYKRTLAYVHRLPDGLFINLAMARDGFALQLTIPPNVAHAEAFGAAVSEARSANRGLWAACDTATTTPTTARATVTTLPPTTQRSVTTTTAASNSGAYYANCDEARRDGAAPLYRGDPGYRPALDRDDDGVACE